MVKWIASWVLGVAMIVAAVSAVVVMNKREAIQRAAAAEAEANEAAEKETTRQARLEEAAAASQAQAAEAERKAAEENRTAQEAARDAAASAAAKAAADREAAVANRAAREAEAATAADNKAAAKAQAEAAKAEAEKAKAAENEEVARAESALAALEKERLQSERVIAEAKLYELKQLELVEMERELLEWKRDLDEREAALRPEKTVADLTWISTDDSVIDADGNLVKKEKSDYRPENDPTLPPAARRLAGVERRLDEARTARRSDARTAQVARLEKLLADALREDRITDADYYRKTLQTLYPDWACPPKTVTKEEEQK